MPTSFSLERARIHVREGRLVVRGGFAPGDEKRYTNALFNFLSMGLAEYVIDLSEVCEVGKEHIGLTMSFAQIASMERPRVVVIASEGVARKFRLAGFDKLGTVRVVSG